MFANCSTRRSITRCEQAAANLGFVTTSALLLAANYGVPQLRYRAFVIGVKGFDPGIPFPSEKDTLRPKIKEGDQFH